jgi:hypothetical protein
MDNVRWNDVVLRDGDIIISTPPKGGTTWMQMICALLIFQSPALPRPLDELSPWVDLLTYRWDELSAEIEAQQHRRVLKSHTPLDGLPFDERVTYISVARDPRDAAISWGNHMANANFDVIMALRADAVGTEDVADLPPGPPPEPPESARDRFWGWVDNVDMMEGLAWTFRHLSSFWRARDRSNVVILHYDDLKADLAGQMRGLAARLGIEIADDRWPELVQAATFDHMRSHASDFAPEIKFWRDPNRFFHRGTSGQWRDVIGADELPRYAARVEELADPELSNWVHRGPILAPAH